MGSAIEWGFINFVQTEHTWDMRAALPIPTHNLNGLLLGLIEVWSKIEPDEVRT